MSWASRRRFIIVSVIAAFFVALIAITLVATLHHTPTCTDHIQNQNEAGVDCGGPCAYLCTLQEQAPVTLFTRALSPLPGRTDIIALVANQNLTAAAKDVPYTVTLYDAQRAVLKTLTGRLDLPPAGSAEGGKQFIFLPAFDTSGQVPASADVSIDPSAVHWFQMQNDERIVPQVGSYTLTNELSAPRISVALSNPTATTLQAVKVIIALYDATNNVIAASQTILQTIPGQGSATALFTWNAPFSAPVASIKVLPIIPLP